MVTGTAGEPIFQIAFNDLLQQTTVLPAQFQHSKEHFVQTAL